MVEAVCMNPADIAEVTLQLRNWAARIQVNFVKPSIEGNSPVVNDYLEVAEELTKLLQRYSTLLQWDARRIDEVAAAMARLDNKLAKDLARAGEINNPTDPNSDLDTSSPSGMTRWSARR